MRSPVETDLPRLTKSGDVIAEVVHAAQRLVSLEIALAKSETKDLVLANAVAAGLLAVGGVLLVLGVLVAVPTLVVILIPWHWMAAVAWIGLYVVLGISLMLAGKARFALKLPTRTLASLKENKEWALRQMRSTVR
ncbi:MAG TPA: phage holin family protein [Candidatus Acidoferrum sp.]|nr:phage holin family protein [Candidatus Acidoferrum sp.]